MLIGVGGPISLIIVVVIILGVVVLFKKLKSKFFN